MGNPRPRPNLSSAFVLGMGIVAVGITTRQLIGGIAFAALVPAMAYAHTRWNGSTTRLAVLEMQLLYGIVAFYGVGGVRAFIGHTLLASDVAHSIGWQPSPFQTELAFYHLAFGVLSLMAIWIRGNLWMAVVIGKAIFLYGAAYVHVHEILRSGNFAPGNAGVETLYVGDLLIPTALIALWALHQRAANARTDEALPAQP